MVPHNRSRTRTQLLLHLNSAFIAASGSGRVQTCHSSCLPAPSTTRPRLQASGSDHTRIVALRSEALILRADRRQLGLGTHPDMSSERRYGHHPRRHLPGSRTVCPALRHAILSGVRLRRTESKDLNRLDRRDTRVRCVRGEQG